MTKIWNSVIILVFLILIFNNSLICFGTNIQLPIQNSHKITEHPQEVWNKTFGGATLDWGWSVQQTQDGGFIIAGETTSFGAGGFDAWLIKTDEMGNEQWNKTFGGSDKDGARSVKQTSDNGYILGGYVDSYGFPGHDAWFIKTDDEGNEEWNSFFGGPASDGTFKVIQTHDEGYLGIGYADSYGAGDHDIWLIKTDSNGNEHWNRTYGTADWELGYSVKQTKDDCFVLIGTTNSYGAGAQDAWLIKTDEYGVEEWNRTYGGTDNDWGSAVLQTEDGGYILTGDTRSFGSGGYDFWLIKTDNYGNEQWKRYYGDSLYDETCYNLKSTSDGGYILTGTKTSFETGLTDYLLIKTDKDGFMQWNLTIDGGNDDWCYSVDETVDGGYIVVGKTNSYGNGNYDIWLIKVELVNHPPEICEIDGTNNGKPEVEYNYTISASDPDGDNVYYTIDWGDETPVTKYGPFESGEKFIINHSWCEKGEYILKARASDIHGLYGEWGNLEVTIPIYKSFILQNFQIYWLCKVLTSKFLLLKLILS